MEKTKEENDEIYISGSKQNIDSFINKNEYRKAFGLLILVLERLDDGAQKNAFIDYYSKNMEQFGIFKNSFPSS
jgi:adenylate kinase family enzyme